MSTVFSKLYTVLYISDLQITLFYRLFYTNFFLQSLKKVRWPKEFNNTYLCLSPYNFGFGGPEELLKISLFSDHHGKTTSYQNLQHIRDFLAHVYNENFSGWFRYTGLCRFQICFMVRLHSFLNFRLDVNRKSRQNT